MTISKLFFILFCVAFIVCYLLGSKLKKTLEQLKQTEENNARLKHNLDCMRLHSERVQAINKTREDMDNEIEVQTSYDDILDTFIDNNNNKL